MVERAVDRAEERLAVGLALAVVECRTALVEPLVHPAVVARHDAQALEQRDRHSAFTPAARITCRQRSVSSFMSAAIAVGVLPIASAERSARRFSTCGSFSPSAIAAGVFGGADTLNQAIDTKPG